MAATAASGHPAQAILALLAQIREWLTFALQSVVAALEVAMFILAIWVAS